MGGWISMHKKQEIIIRNYRNGESISRIAREVAVCRKTVRKYIRAYSEEKKNLTKSSLIKERNSLRRLSSHQNMTVPIVEKERSQMRWFCWQRNV